MDRAVQQYLDQQQVASKLAEDRTNAGIPQLLHQTTPSRFSPMPDPLSAGIIQSQQQQLVMISELPAAHAVVNQQLGQQQIFHKSSQLSHASCAPFQNKPLQPPSCQGNLIPADSFQTRDMFQALGLFSQQPVQAESPSTPFSSSISDTKLFKQLTNQMSEPTPHSAMQAAAGFKKPLLAQTPGLHFSDENAAQPHDNTFKTHQAAARLTQSTRRQGSPGTLQGFFRSVKPLNTSDKEKPHGLSKPPLQQLQQQDPQKLQPLFDTHLNHHPSQPTPSVTLPGAVIGTPVKDVPGGVQVTDTMPPALPDVIVRCEAAVGIRLPARVDPEKVSEQVQERPAGAGSQEQQGAPQPDFLKDVRRIQSEAEVSEFLSGVDGDARYDGGGSSILPVKNVMFL